MAKDDPKDILSLARGLEAAETIEVHSGDREPGADVSARGKRWIVAALRLYAKHVASRAALAPDKEES